MNYKSILPVAPLVKNKFFSDLDTYKHTDEFISKINQIDPNTFLHMDEYFCYVNPQYEQNEVGWKIHLSSIIKTAENLLYDVANYCIYNKISFKFLKDANVLNLLNSKVWGRSSSGKFITIYPSNTNHFKKIIEDLYKITSKYQGPYILSDKRYKDSKVLFYRYGAISVTPKMKFDGSKEYFLTGPNGIKVLDTVKPYYTLPPWIEEPFSFHQDEEDDTGEGLKENRYIIQEALEIQNSGGVYRAYDNLTKEYVILKESRPFIGIDESKYDCMYLRKNELNILTKLKNKDYVPTIIDSFFEWEHFFIVVSEVKGTLLSNYIADLDTGINPQSDLSSIYNSHKKIFLELLINLKDMHTNNISLGDFSTTNIIVKDDKTISFIDLEAANSGDKDNLAFLKYGTPGYRRPQKRERFEDRFIIDKEGLGLTLLNFYTNANDYINLSEQILHNILNDVQKDYKIPIEFIEVINTLIFHSENANLDNLIQKVKNIKVNDFITSEIKLKFSTDQLITELDKVLDCSTNTMLNVIQTKWGKERLFPTHPMEKAQTLYLGDLGVLLSLKYISPNKNINFLVDQYLKNSISKNDELTPGLFSGLCGVAIGSFLLGYKDIAINTFEKARQKSYIFEECLNLKDGIAGYGLTSIFFYQQLQDEKYRTLAKEIASILIKKAKTKENFIYWINNDCIEYGFAQGISGISFFFIELYKITQNARYLDIAKSTILYLIDNATKEKNSLYFNKNSKKEYLSPYLEGSAGIAKTFISYLKVENSVEIQHSLELLLNAYDFKYLKSPSYDYGLAAIGDALIDLYYLEKSPLCLKRLRTVAEGILNYQIKDATNELHFPSAISSHISFDYGTGMSGVIVFLNKLNKLLKHIPKEADLLC